MGVYAKGKLGRFDYRFSVSKPFVTQTASIPIDPLGTNSSYSTMIPQLAYQGYFMVQLKDIEGNAGPWNCWIIPQEEKSVQCGLWVRQPIQSDVEQDIRQRYGLPCHEPLGGGCIL